MHSVDGVVELREPAGRDVLDGTQVDDANTTPARDRVGRCVKGAFSVAVEQ